MGICFGTLQATITYPHQTKKGKQNHRSQKCWLVGDMWSFPGGYQFVNFRWVYLGYFEEFFLAPGGITDQNLQTAATTTFLYQIQGSAKKWSILLILIVKIIIWLLLFLRKTKLVNSFIVFVCIICLFWAQKRFGPHIMTYLYIYIYILYSFDLFIRINYVHMCLFQCFCIIILKKSPQH